MLYLMRIIRERTRPVPKKTTAWLTAETEGNKATVRLGDHKFTIRSGYDGRLSHDNYDFALFGAICLGLSRNIDIKTDLLISSQTLAAVRKFNDLMMIWNPRKIYPISIFANNIYDAPGTDPNSNGLLCLSGGVDSTFSAITARPDIRLTHGMLVAGLDYSDTQNAGFQSLSERLDKFSQKTGYEFFTTETTLRHMGIHWEMLNLPLLAMCLSFHSSVFGRGIVSSDYTAGTELACHPFHNSGPAANALSTSNFPILHLGQETVRSAKVIAIANDPRDLLASISVCNKADGGRKNCGICEKCIRTKLNLMCGGFERPDLFAQNPDLATLVDRLKFPKSMANRRRLLCWVCDNENNLPEGDVKDALTRCRIRLRASLVPLGRI